MLGKLEVCQKTCILIFSKQEALVLKYSQCCENYGKVRHFMNQNTICSHPTISNCQGFLEMPGRELTISRYGVTQVGGLGGLLLAFVALFTFLCPHLPNERKYGTSSDCSFSVNAITVQEFHRKAFWMVFIPFFTCPLVMSSLVFTDACCYHKPESLFF